jgi:hypothetical protein
MNCLRLLGRWDRGFESNSGHGYLVCVCVYSVFVLLVQGALLKKRQGPKKGIGSRAIVE